MKYLGVAGVLLGLSLLGVPALADEAKQPVPRVGQVVIESMGPASGTIPKGKLATIVNYIHADKHTWYKNGSRHTAKYPFNKGTQRNLHDRFVLKMRYGLGDGYDVRFATPIVMNNFRAHSTLTPNSVSSKNGIGDTTFVLHKQFLSQREGSPVDMAWDLGVWTPTGGTSDDGVGTGAWGAMAGLGVGHAFDGGRRFISGNRCSRPLGEEPTRHPDLMRYKYAKLRSLHGKGSGDGSRGRIGIPFGLNMYENLPVDPPQLRGGPLPGVQPEALPQGTAHHPLGHGVLPRQAAPRPCNVPGGAGGRRHLLPLYAL